MANRPMYLVQTVESGRHNAVFSMLRDGEEPNCNWLGVVPLHLAIEEGDVDMVTLLLKFGANPEYSGSKATILATKMSKDPKEEKKAKGQLILKLMKDPKFVEERTEGLLEKLNEQTAQDKKFMKYTMMGFAGIAVVALAGHQLYHFLKTSGNVQEL